MKINANNDIFVYRGETAAIDFKISQRSDYYVPFLVSSGRALTNPMVCISIGSTRRETKNIVSKQLWLTWANLGSLPMFSQTVVTDLGTLSAASEVAIDTLMAVGIMYQFMRETEVAAGNPQLHFAYEAVEGTAIIDDYNFTIILSIDETITLDMTSTDYFYQIELMNTVPMLEHLLTIFEDITLHTKLPTGFTTLYTGTSPTAAITEYWSQCIALVTKTWPNYWGYRILDPLTSPVARVSNIQMLQPPRRFVVQSVIK